jgi:nitrite reductase/ring-hydroxylating ferredoxin subunit
MNSPSMHSIPTQIRLCHTADIPAGGTLKVEHSDLILAIFNVDGEFFVTNDSCTHGPGSLSEGYLEGDIIECNFHGGQFNVRTGEVVGPPCMVPVKTYKVIIEDGNVFIEI